MKTITSAVLTLLISFSAFALEVVNYPTYLNGPQQMQVTLLPLTNDTNVLVQIRGVNHPIDQVVFLADIQDRGQGVEAYRIQYDGQPRAILLKGNRWGRDYYQAFLPDTGRDDIYLDLAENTDDFISTSALLDRYNSQQAEGVQERLAQFDRAKHQASAQRLLEERDAEAKAQCNTNITTQVDWEHIDDSRLQSLSIGAYCGQVAEEMARICRRMPEFKADFVDLKLVQCQFGDGLKLRRQDEVIRFYTTREAPNQGEFVNSFLRNF